MLDALPKAFFASLAGSAALKTAASKYGMRHSGSFARRFVAGENAAEAIEAARVIEQQGLSVTLDLLGEGVTSAEAAGEATRAYLGVIGEIANSGVTRNISIKLTQLGLDIDHATALDNLRRVLDAARAADFFVRIDMEASAYTARTLDLFEQAWRMGYTNAGVVLQSYLRDAERDVRRMMALGARIRLVKGAYREPKEVAFQQKAEVDAAYVHLMQILLEGGTFPAIATHDPAMIAATRDFATKRGIAKDRFEFQMLYGIRRDLQAALHAEGYGMRVYVPFGREWFPYFMRRLGERPANVGFVLRSLVKEKS